MTEQIVVPFTDREPVTDIAFTSHLTSPEVLLRKRSEKYMNAHPFCNTCFVADTQEKLLGYKNECNKSRLLGTRPPQKPNINAMYKDSDFAKFGQHMKEGKIFSSLGLYRIVEPSTTAGTTEEKSVYKREFMLDLVCQSCRRGQSVPITEPEAIRRGWKQAEPFKLPA